MTTFLRRVCRLVLLAVHLLAGTILALLLGGDRAAPRFLAVRQRWHARLCRILGLDLRLRGDPAPVTSFHVANHVSWLDVPVLGSCAPLGFLSKAEVRRWPLVGWLAARAGTLFIERGGKDAAATAAARIAACLDRGLAVAVFPEGTTTDGRQLRRFHPRLFAAALEGGHPVQPVALRYLDERGEPHAAVPFIGDASFHVHLWRILGERRITVEVTFCPPLAGDGRERERAAVADAAHGAIAGALNVSHPPLSQQ